MTRLAKIGSVGLAVLVVTGVSLAIWLNQMDDSTSTENSNLSETTPTSVSTTTTPSVAACTSSPTGQFDWSGQTQGPYRDSVGFATSTDLLNWTDSGLTLAEHASVPEMIVKNGELWVYYVDISQDGVAEQLQLIRSADQGKTWSAPTAITLSGACDKVAVDPDPYLLPDGSVRLYFFDINVRAQKSETAPNSIYSAISTDGVNFVLDEGVRLTAANIFDPEVVKTDVGYRLYVGQYEGQSNTVIAADSTDGLSFGETTLVYDEGGVPGVIRDGDRYLLYTVGITISSSADGLDFSERVGSFRSDMGMLTADPGVAQIAPGLYGMVYKYK